MAKLRVRIKLNEGGEGAPLDQLVHAGKELELFLRYLADDAGFSVAKGKWLARKFENESVSFDSEGGGEYTDDQVRTFNAALSYCSSFNPDTDKLNGKVQYRTLLQYSKIAEPLQPHEKIGIGIYEPRAERPNWRTLTKRDATTLHERLTETVTYVGSLRGRIHRLSIETPLEFNVRLLRTNELVPCRASDDLFERVHEAANRQNALVYVRGRITARRIDRHVTSVRVSNVRAAPTLDDESYERFFGLNERYTGHMTTEEFIDEARGYDH